MSEYVDRRQEWHARVEDAWEHLRGAECLQHYLLRMESRERQDALAADLENYRLRLTRALSTLAVVVTDAPETRDRDRLQGKCEGVGLALSYLDEALYQVYRHTGGEVNL